MVKPINKKHFGANTANNIKVQFHNGTSSVPGLIVKQQGTKKFLCQDANGVQASCFLVTKKYNELLVGEMSISVKDKNGNVYQVSKIVGKTLTANGKTFVWLFQTPELGEVQIEEAGDDELLTNADDFEGDETDEDDDNDDEDDDNEGYIATVFVGTNSYITFGGGYEEYSNLSATNPPAPKIFLAAGDNSIQRVLWNIFGTAPERVFIARTEGVDSTSGDYGNSNMIFEYRFFENVPSKIQIFCISNARYGTSNPGLNN